MWTPSGSVDDFRGTVNNHPIRCQQNGLTGIKSPINFGRIESLLEFLSNRLQMFELKTIPKRPLELGRSPCSVAEQIPGDHFLRPSPWPQKFSKRGSIVAPQRSI